MSDQSVPQPATTNSRLMMVGTLLVGVVATFVVLYALTNRARTPATPTVNYSDNFEGVQIVNPPRQVQDFTLTNQLGDPVSLSSFRGKLVLMFFGFTNCEDVCPITLLEFKQIRQKLGAQADKVAFLFISVDPQRDTPSVIKTYLERFDPAITGMAGDMQVFDAVKNDYNLEFIQVPNPDGSSGSAYSISHTPNPFLLDANGKLVARYAYGTDIRLIINDLTSRLGA